MKKILIAIGITLIGCRAEKIHYRDISFSKGQYTLYQIALDNLSPGRGVEITKSYDSTLTISIVDHCKGCTDTADVYVVMMGQIIDTIKIPRSRRFSIKP